MGLFGGKKQAVGWHATEDPEVVRYFDGQRWKGHARLIAVDDLGPLPFTAEAQKQKTIAALLEQQSQIEGALRRATAAYKELGQQRSELEQQITELRQEHAEATHENYLREINLRDFPTVADGSSKIAEALKEVRAEAKQLIKDGKALSTHSQLATFFDTNSGFDSPIRKLLRKDITTMLLGIFNAECEAATRAMRSMESLNTAGDRIRRVWEKLHTAALPIGVTISNEYVSIKLQETHLVWEHLVAKAIDRAEAPDARDRLREEAKRRRSMRSRWMGWRRSSITT